MATQKLELTPARPVRARTRSGRRRSHRIVGLFAGIGGLERGLELEGHKTVLLSELDPAARQVLRGSLLRGRRVRIIPDVRDVRPSSVPATATLIAAGFPCQDLSQAGRTAGIRGGHSGRVQMLFRLLDGLRRARGSRKGLPWILLENVPFLLHLEGGEGMRWLVTQFEKRGYRWAYRVVDTRAFGLPHRRERVFLLACPDDDPCRFLFADDTHVLPARGGTPSDAFGFYWTEGNRGIGWAEDAIPTLKVGSGCGIPSPPAVWLPSRGLVIPTLAAAERLQGFSTGWTRPAARNGDQRHRWRLIGNAVSVPAARWLGSCLARPAASYNGGGTPLTEGAPWPSAAWSDGRQRYASQVSPWPVAREGISLAKVIGRDCQPLSLRAAKGFLDRYERSSLKKRGQLIRALRAHLDSGQR